MILYCDLLNVGNYMEFAYLVLLYGYLLRLVLIPNTDNFTALLTQQFSFCLPKHDQTIAFCVSHYS